MPLVTSVVIVIRPRAENAPVDYAQEFFDELDTQLPIVLDRITAAVISPRPIFLKPQ